MPTAALTLFSRGLFRPQLSLSLFPLQFLFYPHPCSISSHLCPCSHPNLHPIPILIPHPSPLLIPSHPSSTFTAFPAPSPSPLHPISYPVSSSFLISSPSPSCDHYHYCSHSISTPATLYSPHLREPHTIPTSPAWDASPSPWGRLLLLAGRLPVFISELTAAELQSYDAAA